MDIPKIDGYDITRLLGEGGMGAVFHAHDLRRNTDVALKIILPQHLSDPEAQQRFQREIAILSRVVHANVVRYHDSGECEAGPYLAMEYLEGENAAERLRRGPCTPRESLQIGLDVVGALAAVYSANVLHRDIKPSNVFLTRAGAAKVTDFGIAKRHDVDVRVTKTGYIVGTPAYASPEQIQGHRLTFLSDVYSVGILLYELIAGRHPYDCSDPIKLLRQHLSDPLPPIPYDDVPTYVIDFLKRLNSKSPQLRAASYDALLEELTNLRDLCPIARSAAGEHNEVVIPSAGLTQFSSLVARCFCCSRDYGQFTPAHRLCEAIDCPSQQFSRRHRKETKLFVSLLPERRTGTTGVVLPSLTEGDDVFAHAPNFLNISVRDREFASSTPLPYSTDHLSRLGLRCGRPLVYDSPRVARWSGFARVVILDMSTYAWSHTLKDARSWAILNVALENGMHKLALYTAGNAGISITRLAYEVNRLLPKDRKRIEISLLVDETVTARMKAILSSWGARIFPVHHDPRRLLDPEMIWLRVGGDEDGGTGAVPAGGWHVTDGWDGVGITMYRLIVAQVLRQIDASYVVAPLGTGSLLLGAYLGIHDAAEPGRTVRLTGAVPAGENVLRVCREPDLPDRQPSDSVMEKLVGRYSPLAPCISVLDRERADVDFVEVTHTMLEDAADNLFGHIAAEPSAIAAFAALRGGESARGVIDRAQAIEDASHPRGLYYQSPSTALVISSGLGLTTEREAAFLAKHLRGAIA